jgi:predicted dehydrogenase
MSTIKLGLIGASKWAELYHIPAVKALEREEKVSIVGVWNRTPATAVSTAQKYGIEKVYSTLDIAVNDPCLDGFIVAIHQSVVGAVIAKVLKRGLPFLTEKPPGNDAAEATRLARQVTVPNVVAFNRRYCPLNQQFKEIVDRMKNVYFTECHFYRHERLYKDFVIATGIHGVNYLEFLFGEIVNLQTERWPNPENDTFLWVSSIQFASGVKGIIKFFPCSGASIERFEVHSKNTSAYLKSAQHFTTDIPGKIVVYKKMELESIIESPQNEPPLVGSGYVNLYKDFLGAVRRNTPTLSNFGNAWRSMVVAESIEKGVPLP